MNKNLIQNELPPQCSIEQQNGKTYMRYGTRYLVSVNTGQRAYVNGTDEKATKKAVNRLWRMAEGYDYDRYEWERR